VRRGQTTHNAPGFPCDPSSSPSRPTLQEASDTVVRATTAHGSRYTGQHTHIRPCPGNQAPRHPGASVLMHPGTHPRTQAPTDPGTRPRTQAPDHPGTQAPRHPEAVLMHPCAHPHIPAALACRSLARRRVSSAMGPTVPQSTDGATVVGTVDGASSVEAGASSSCTNGDTVRVGEGLRGLCRGFLNQGDLCRHTGLQRTHREHRGRAVSGSTSAFNGPSGGTNGF
jgi:hypothetical protein